MGDSAPPRQQGVSQKLAAASARALRDQASPCDQTRLQAYSAPGAGRWLGSAPSETLDKHLTSQQLFTTTAARLGVDVYEEDGSCNFCGAVLDAKGVHALSCTCGGDMIFAHNAVRDLVFDFARRGRLNPELEKAGLLQDPMVWLICGGLRMSWWILLLQRVAALLGQLWTSR